MSRRAAPRHMHLMDPVPPYFQVLHHSPLEFQPFLPALPDSVPFYIGLRQFNEQMIVTGLAFHKTPVELSEILIPEPLAQPFEPFAASGFYQGKNEQLVHEPFLITAPFLLKLHQPVHILILPLPAQDKLPFAELGHDQAKMPPFFRYVTREVLY